MSKLDLTRVQNTCLREIAILSTTLCILVALIISIDAANGLEQDATPSSVDRSKLELPKVFDFDYYRQFFKKTYSSIAEELIRRKIFLARALRSFVSGVAYKYRRSNYYLSLNPQSDWTASEVLNSELSYLREDGSVAFDLSLNDTSLEVENLPPEDLQPMLDIEDVELELDSISNLSDQPEQIKKEIKTINEKLHGQVQDDPMDLSRRRRSVEDEPRAFSFDTLIDRPLKVEETPETKAKITQSIPSNNPEYEPPELTSMGWSLPSLSSNMNWSGLLDKFSASKKSDTSATSGDKEADEKKSTNFFARLLKAKAGAPGLPDEVFFDHRKSDCFTEIQDQGTCGACYVFSAVAYFEWLFCKKTDKLIKLSEQYVIDCAPESEFKTHLNGCKGGTFLKMGNFFAKYGTELTRNYPYTEQEGKCPYEVDENPKKMGYLKFGQESAKGVAIPINKWSEYLPIAPLVVKVGSRGDFREYGGGVHSGKDCCQGFDEENCGRHSMLLVGHGRQDGEEYWLMRNSYSVAYGEKGYYKLSKNSNCIHPKKGFMFAYGKGKKVDLVIKKNSMRPASVDKRINDSSRYASKRSRNSDEVGEPTPSGEYPENKIKRIKTE